VLTDALVTAAVRCAPPGNKPSPGERAACQPYLEAEFAAIRGVRVIVTLGKIADDTVGALHREDERHVSHAARRL
jgi:uracil-DNA glycosylase family 4